MGGARAEASPRPQAGPARDGAAPLGDTPTLELGTGRVNVGSDYARSRFARQLVFYESKLQETQTTQELSATFLATDALPDIPN